MRKFDKVSYFEGEVILPSRSTKNSAGYDFISPVDKVIKPKEEYIVDTGVKAYMNPGEVLLILPRSSYGFKFHMSLSNTVGVIDADYVDNPSNEGDIMVKVYNGGNKPLELKKGQAFAQGIFVSFLTTDDDDADKERIGGIGSTDKEA